MHFNGLDWSALGIFFIVLLGIPVLASRKSKATQQDYFLSGRSMPWWLVGISMVAASTSTNSANLFTELIRKNGLFGNWVWWAFLLTGILTVFVYARLWHRTGATTDLEFYELRYSGRPAACLRAFRAVYLGIVYNLVTTAVVLLGAVKIGTVMFGVSATTILVVTAVISLVYSVFSGIRGTIYADFFLFLVIMAGAVAVMVYALQQPEVGGFTQLISNAAVIRKASFLPSFSDPDTLVAVFIIPVAVQWWNVWYSGSEPGGGGYVVQRMLTAKTPNHALGGTLFYNVVNYALRPWPWYIVAFCSILVFPQLADIQKAFPNVDPKLVGHDMAYPAMIKFVPNGWLGVVAASMMGALFSTVAAHLTMGSAYMVNDLYRRFWRPKASDRELILAARLSSLFLMVVACLIVPFFESAKAGFDIMVQVGAGTGIVFLLRWFWMRINAWTEIAAMSVSVIAAVVTQTVWPRFVDDPKQLLFWHKLLATIVPTTIAWLLATYLTKPEPAEVIARFRAVVRTQGRDVGLGVLLTAVCALGIYAFMYAVGAWIFGNFLAAGVMTVVAVAAGLFTWRGFRRLKVGAEDAR